MWPFINPECTNQVPGAYSVTIGRPTWGKQKSMKWQLRLVLLLFFTKDSKDLKKQQQFVKQETKLNMNEHVYIEQITKKKHLNACRLLKLTMVPY